MLRRKQNWYCRSCEHISSEAHVSALNDYKMLIGDHISNKQARDFLLVELSYVVKRLLKKAGFNCAENTKAGVYQL